MHQAQWYVSGYHGLKLWLVEVKSKLSAHSGWLMPFEMVGGWGFRTCWVVERHEDPASVRRYGCYGWIFGVSVNRNMGI